MNDFTLRMSPLFFFGGANGWARWDKSVLKKPKEAYSLPKPEAFQGLQYLHAGVRGIVD
jgi:hypothetical protein